METSQETPPSRGLGQDDDQARGVRRYVDDDPGAERRAEPEKKATLAEREPVRIAGAVATLAAAVSLVVFGLEVTADQRDMIRELVVLAMTVMTPMVAGVEVMRSKVDSPATVKRKVREKGRPLRRIILPLLAVGLIDRPPRVRARPIC